MDSFLPLFRKTSAIDDLKLFRKLFDSSEIDNDLALALLKVIHRDLSNEQERDRSAYKKYAELIEALRYHKADMLKQIVEAWKVGKTEKETDWLSSDGIIK